MIRAFLDSSALYSAVVSPTGAGRELLKRYRQGQLALVVSPYVIGEVERNIRRDAPAHLNAFILALDLLSFEVVEPDQSLLDTTEQYVVLKDAPVVAGAISAGCEYLLTYDRADLIDPPLVAEKSGLKIYTPGDLIQFLRSTDK
ncbi:MAG: PIN domain-containing protein [Anaerolineae bacterium]|nr:PIN domain-containing protein [Anaerolineae bacterium]MCA9909955.1 PIN domain-containing protein [Anaerolineae bacterium]